MSADPSRASIQIAAAPADVWKTVMDPDRLGDWVTIHRELHHADDGPPRVGYRMDQQIHLRGVSLDVHWKLVDAAPASEPCGRVADRPAHARAPNTS